MGPHSDFNLCSIKQMWLLFSVPPIRCGCFCSLFHQSDVAVFVFCSTNQMWLLLMGKECRSAMSQLIELLDREGQYKLTYSPAASPSAKVVVPLEAAKRISFAVTVRATCMAEKVQKCLQ